MKDKTLTPDHIKKIFKHFPDIEGFNIHESLDKTYFLEYKEDDDYRYVLGSDCDYVIYDHFLSRTIEAINKRKTENDFEYEIVSFSSVIRVYKNNANIKDYYLFEMTTDQAKTHAILYIIDQIEDNNEQGVN